MTKFRFLFCIFVLSLLISCSNNDNRIPIGVILPLHGESASFGQMTKDNILLAYQHCDTTKYKLYFADSESKSETAVREFRKFIHLYDVKYVIGDLGSNITQSLIPIAEDNGVFLLSPGASAPSLSNASPYFARLFPSDVDESKDVASLCASRFSHSKIAVVYSNNEFGIGLKDGFLNGIADEGLSASVVECYEIAQLDFKLILSKIRNMQCDFIYLAGEEKGMGRFMKQYNDFHLSCSIVSTISFTQPDCLNTAGDAAEGVIIPTRTYNPGNLNFIGAEKFKRSIENEYGRVATMVDAVTYGSLLIMIDAIEHGNTPFESAAYIRNHKNYQCPLGEIDFSNGDVSMPVLMMQIHNKELCPML